MYLSKIQLYNIRCFENLTLELGVNEESPQWTMILGDNSSGKTTVLRSIALALQNLGNSSYLFNGWRGVVSKSSDKVFLKKNDLLKNIVIKHEFDYGLDDYDNYNEFSWIQVELLKNDLKSMIQTPIFKDKYQEEVVFKIPSKSDIYEKVFICAYGASRSLQGYKQFRKDITTYSCLQSVNSLFDNSAQLGSLDTYLVSEKHKGSDTYDFVMNVITEIFKSSSFDQSNSFKSLFHNDIELMVKLTSGLDIPLNAFGDGYKTLSTMLIDIFGWALLKNKIEEFNKLEGIILIDELEQHLHPLWQRKIVKTLRDLFPKIQFITTTHSPLVAASMADIENSKILHLKNNGKYEVLEGDYFKGLRTDQILTSFIFGLETSRNKDVEEKVSKLEKLTFKSSLTEEELVEKRQLEVELSDIPLETAEREDLRQEQACLKQLLSEYNHIIQHNKILFHFDKNSINDTEIKFSELNDYNEVELNILKVLKVKGPLSLKEIIHELSCIFPYDDKVNEVKKYLNKFLKKGILKKLLYQVEDSCDD